MTKEKTLTVGEDMKQRRTFYPTESATALESAQQYLAQCIERFEDFGSIPFVGPGLSADEEGNTVFDPEVYADSVGVMVGVLKKQGQSVKCTFIAPIPDLPAFVANFDDEASRKWAVGILEKEANHVAVRHLRTAGVDELEDAAAQMPHSVEAYTTSSRGVSSGLMEAFNQLYKTISDTIGSKVNAWSRARLTKNELKRSLESSAYALEYYPALEDRGDKPSLFALAIDLGVNGAKAKGYDPAIFERWKATRDQKPFTPEDSDEEEDDLDLDALTDDLFDDEESEGEGDTTDNGDSTE